MTALESNYRTIKCISHPPDHETK